MENQEKSPRFYEAISAMMFGFGDNQNPLIETVNLVENIVLKQLQELLQKASIQAESKSTKKIDAKEILFLFRNDRHKMQRFIKFLDYKIMTNSITKESNDKKNVGKDAKKYRDLREFIEQIDEMAELTDVDEFDTVKYERVLRAERISSSYNEQKYKEYTKARQASFFNKQFCKPEEFRKWIDPKSELNLTNFAIELLELLGYNIVGHLVDLALIVKHNCKHTAGDPLKMLAGGYFNSAMFNAPHISSNNINLGQPPITVREMQEVLRRCYTPQVGYLKFSYKSILGKRKHTLY